jgi:hypothetical protein
VVSAAIGARDKSAVVRVATIGADNLDQVTVVVVAAAIDDRCVNEAAPTIRNCDNLNQVAATTAPVGTKRFTQVAMVVVATVWS